MNHILGHNLIAQPTLVIQNTQPWSNGNLRAPLSSDSYSPLRTTFFPQGTIPSSELHNTQSSSELIRMTPKLKKLIKRGVSAVQNRFKETLTQSKCLHNSNETPSDPSGDTAIRQEKRKHVTLIERVNDLTTTISSRRNSIASSILHKQRQSTSLDINRADPVLPPELIEKIASFMNQHELLQFSKVSRDAYTAAERHLYRRPYTRRFDKLLRTLERAPYKGELILELALGFETDFYSAKYCHQLFIFIIRGPNYDREKVYSELLSRTPNLQQLIYQGRLQWTVSVTQPFAGRHAYVMTVPTRVQTGAVPVELLNKIPSTLKHLQFRHVYGKYSNILEVIQRNDTLETLNIYELGDLESLHLEKLLDLPVAQNLKALRLRHLPHHGEIDHGALAAKILPHLLSLKTFTCEVSSLEDEPFFSTFIGCKQI